MKKKNYIMFSLITACLCLSACGGNDVSQKENKNVMVSQKEEKQYKETSGNIKQEKNDDISVDEGGIDIKKYKNIEEVSSECDYAISSDLQDMSAEAQEIVEAKIIALKYVAIDGDAWTKIDLEIQQGLYGNLQKGDVVTLYQSGGYVPLVDHIAYYDDAFRYKDWSKKKIQNTVLKETIDGETEPVVGDQAVYYLTKFEKKGQLDGNYGRVCGKYAELEKISDNVYQHEEMSGKNKPKEVSLSEIKNEIK